MEAKHTNAGLRDQLAALECELQRELTVLYVEINHSSGVRDNIENFGGDPRRGKDFRDPTFKTLCQSDMLITTSSK